MGAFDPRRDGRRTTMNIPQKLLAALLCAALTLTLCVGCNKTPKKSEDELFTLRACVCGPITSLDPSHSTDTAANSVFAALFENLLRLETDENGVQTLAMGLAREYETHENYDGTTTYTFTLRSAARWSNGERVKAEDFVFAWRRLVDPTRENPNCDLLHMIVGYDEVRESGDTSLLAVTAESGSVLSVTVDSDCVHFLQSVCTSPVAAPMQRKAVQSDDWTDAESVVCCGPYRVESWEAADTLVLTKNEEYYGAQTDAPDRMIFTLSDDEQSAYERYCSGELDVISFSDALALREEDEAIRRPTARTLCVLFNQLSDWLGDDAIRAALFATVDREELLSALGAQANALATGLVPDGIASNVQGVSFREASGELLGSENESTGQTRTALAQSRLEDLQQSETALRLICLQDVQNERLAGLLCAQWLLRLNVSVECEALTQEEYEARLAAGEYDLALSELSAVRDDAWEFLDCWRSENENNVIGSANTSYDLLLGAAENSSDPAARMAFLCDAEALLLQDCALLPLAFTGRACLVRDGLQGLDFAATRDTLDLSHIAAND